MKAAVFDFGAGNLHSLTRALEKLGVEARIETDAAKCTSAELMILPGVGAFGPAAARLEPAREQVKKALESGLPCIGICLGMQLLFDGSDEGPGEGLGLISGRVTRLTARRTPHIGWTRIDGVPTEMYFAHSYACRPADPSLVTSWATHDSDRIAAVVKKQRTVGVQFHPEKSSGAGLVLLGTLITEVTK